MKGELFMNSKKRPLLDLLLINLREAAAQAGVQHGYGSRSARSVVSWYSAKKDTFTVNTVIELGMVKWKKAEG